MRMRSIVRYQLALLSFVILAFNTQAQERITGEFNGVTFSEFVRSVESSSSYHFYFNNTWTDSVVVTTRIDNKRLEEVLDQVLAGTDLRYTIDRNFNVYITKGRSILAELPQNFFTPSQGTQQPDFDYTEYEQKERQKKIVESKLYFIGKKTSDLSGTATITGQITLATTGEVVVGASVYIENPTIGAGTDPFGNFNLTIPKGRHELKVKSIGMKSTVRQVMVYGNGRLNIEMEEDVTPLKEVIVESDRDINVTGMQMGLEKLDIKTMKQIPLALGETDVLKVVLTLPGVQSVGEGSSGINVRGGATSQNLILFNDATVYNPSHLFGFFSTFNPDVLKNVELYKSGITADYGGRLSSVLDVTSREGNLKKFSGAGGISPITGRLTLDIPLIKDKTSLMIAGRSTYSDWILRQLKSTSLQNSKASFYDFNAVVSHKLSDKSQIMASAYMSQDNFRLNSDTLYSYSDRNASIKWKYGISKKLFGTLTGGFSQYHYNIESTRTPTNAFNLGFSIQQLNAKADFSYFHNAKHTFSAGLSTIRYKLKPGTYEPVGADSEVVTDILETEHAQESAVYVGDNIEVSSRLSLYLGLRYSFYQYLGPRTVFTYPSGVPREEATIADTVSYSSGSTVASYAGPEPRISLRYSLPGNASVKFSYNRTRQYIHMLSNTTAIAPTDTWKLADQYIPPQIGDQIAIGFYKNIKGSVLETSVEAYYKDLKNAIDYKGSATLLLNHHLETDILTAVGQAYGVELLVKKPGGKLNGWMSYTYSRSLLKTQGQFSSETVNGGRYYPSNYDKPHAVNFVGNYKFNRRFNFSLNTTYSTGRPITFPLAKYDLGGSPRLYYSERNKYRIPDYFRLDISINIEGNHKIKKLAHSSWTLAVYNVTGRENAYSIYFTAVDGKVTGYKLSVFARPIPTITYNFKF